MRKDVSHKLDNGTLPDSRPPNVVGTRGDCECEKSRPIFTLAYAIALSKRESAFASPELRSIGDARTTRANAGR